MLRTISAVSRALGCFRGDRTHSGRSAPWAVALGALLLVASTASVVATQNSAPVLGGLRQSSRSINEGESLTLAGIFDDPDANQPHTLLVYWYGGDSDEKQKVLLPAGQNTFELTHAYTDNFPPQPIKVVVFDHDLPDRSNDNHGGMLSDTELLPFEVRNVDPRFVETSITVNKAAKPKVVVEGDVVDPGTADQVQVFATWSDQAAPETTQCSLSNGERHFRCEHTYPLNYGFMLKRTYTINLIVKDHDGGWAQHETKVTLP
jgi:hypothetical protein